MQHVERAGTDDRAAEAPEHADPAKPRRPVDAADVVDRRAGKRIGARFAIIVEREDVDLVAPRQALHEPDERRYDAASRGVETTGGHQPDTHTHVIRILVAITLALTTALTTVACARAGRPTLDIYFIDVEGGQSTLIVTPAGSRCWSTPDFPGTAPSLGPGDLAKARDAQRILAAARYAGVSRIDYLLVTHFHADHDGGVPELARLMPIRTFVDHGGINADADARAAGRRGARRYAAVRARGSTSSRRPALAFRSQAST